MREKCDLCGRESVVYCPFLKNGNVHFCNNCHHLFHRKARETFGDEYTHLSQEEIVKFIESLCSKGKEKVEFT